MTSEPQYFSTVVIALFMAVLASAILWRRQWKQSRTVEMGPTMAVFVVAALAALAWLIVAPAALRQAGLELGTWSQQAIQVATALIAYLAAGRLLGRIQERGSNAH